MGEILQTIQSQSTNLNAGDISLLAIGSNPAVAKILFFFKVALWLALFFAVVWIVWKFLLQYRVKVTIYSRIAGGGIETIQDRAKIVTDKEGRTKLALLKTRKGKMVLTSPIPSNEFKTKIGKTDHYHVWIDDNFHLHPIFPPRADRENSLFKVIPEERKAWSRQERRSVEKQYENKNMLDKYLPSMIVLSSFMVAFLIFFFMSKDLAASMSALTGEFGRVADACLQLK